MAKRYIIDYTKFTYGTLLKIIFNQVGISQTAWADIIFINSPESDASIISRWLSDACVPDEIKEKNLIDAISDASIQNCIREKFEHCLKNSPLSEKTAKLCLEVTDFKQFVKTVFMHAKVLEKASSREAGNTGLESGTQDEAAIEKNYRSYLYDDLCNWCGLGIDRDILLEKIYINHNLKSIPDGTMITDIELLHAISQKKEINRAIVYGSAGSGKSTLFKIWCLKQIEDQSMIPVFIPLGKLEKFYIQKDDWNQTLPEVLANYYKDLADKNSFLRFVDKKIKSGKAVIFLDAADEIPLESAGFASAWIEHVYKSSSNCPIVISSRPNVEFLKSFTGFRRYTVDPFDYNGQVISFIKKWFDVNQALADELTAIINDEKNDSVKNMTYKPLFLTFICIEFERKKSVSRTPGLLMLQYIRILLQDWERAKNCIRFYKYQLTEDILSLEIILLSILANRYFENNMEKFSENDMYLTVEEYFKNAGTFNDYRLLVKQIEDTSGIIEREDFGFIHFHHRLIQEFFVAIFLINSQKKNEIDLQAIYNKYFFKDRYKEVMAFYNDLMEAGY